MKWLRGLASDVSFQASIFEQDLQVLVWELYGMENSIPVQISNFLTHQPNETSDNNAYKAIPLLITPDLYV